MQEGALSDPHSLRHGQVTGFGQWHEKGRVPFTVNTLSVSQYFAEFPLQSKPTRSRTVVDRVPCTATVGK